MEGQFRSSVGDREKEREKERKEKDTQTPLRLEKKNQRREGKALPPKGPHPPRLEAVEAERPERESHQHKTKPVHLKGTG